VFDAGEGKTGWLRSISGIVSASTASQQRRYRCPGTDTHLKYMIDIALSTEFLLAAGSAR
jgi:hypothetical protein